MHHRFESVTGHGLSPAVLREHLIGAQDTQSGHLHQLDWESILTDRLGYQSGDWDGGENWAVDGPRAGLVLQPWRVAQDAQGNGRLMVWVSEQAHVRASYYHKGWTASDVERLSWLLSANNVRFGIVTNGSEWVLIDAPEQTERSTLLWSQAQWRTSPIAWATFASLLHRQSVLDSQLIDKVFDQSAKSQPDTMLRIGGQVRRALGCLVQAIGRANNASRGSICVDATGQAIDELGLRDGAVHWMMRLLVQISLEARGVIQWQGLEGYSVLGMYQQLMQGLRRGDAGMAQSTEAWRALQAAHHIIHAGLPGGRVGYGGSLFDAQAHPWLSDERIAWSDQVVWVMLDALLRIASSQDDVFMDFAFVSEEQVGQIYESLIESTVTSQPDVVLCIAGAQDIDVEVSMHEIDTWLQQGGVTSVVAAVAERSGRSEIYLREHLLPSAMTSPTHLAQALTSQEDISRVLPWSGWLRHDPLGIPMCIAPSTPYLSIGTERKQAGAHYTPASMVNMVVRKALELLTAPLNANAQPTLARPADILRLRVCDPAMGSGAFLVGACRYLADALVASWVQYEGHIISPASHMQARRHIAERCLSGVDINPTAVQLARMSLWLTTADPDRPFTFIDHALQCGDSLLAISLRELVYWSADKTHARQSTRDRMRSAGLPYAAWQNPAGQEHFDMQHMVALLEEVQRDLDHIGDAPSDTLEQVRHKESLHAQAMDRMQPIMVFADLLAATCVIGDVYRRRTQHLAADEATLQIASWPSAKRLSGEWCDLASTFFRSQSSDSERRQALSRATHERDALFGATRPYHWQLLTTKKHAFVGNPPFLGASATSTLLGSDWSKRQREIWGWDSWQGRDVSATQADLATFFVGLAASMSLPQSVIGFITTHSIGKGESSRVALEPLVGAGPDDHRDWQVAYALPNMRWPGEAAVHVALFTLVRGGWHGTPRLGNTFGGQGVPVVRINATFTEHRRVAIKPQSLPHAQIRACAGDELITPFLLDATQQQQLLALEPQAAHILHDALRGNDIVKSPRQEASRKAIVLPASKEQAQATYPVAWKLLQELVPAQKQRQQKWWNVARHEAMQGRNQVLVQAYTAKYIAPSMVNADMYVVSPNVVIASDRYATAMICESAIHSVWVQELGTTLGATSWRYSHTSIVHTFPVPEDWQEQVAWEELGREYHSLRNQIMQTRSVGLTHVCNMIHDARTQDSEVRRMRDIRRAFEHELLQAYGWKDLASIGMDWHPTKSCILLTFDAATRAEIAARLMECNTLHYGQQSKSGILGKSKTRTNKHEELLAQGQQDMWS